ncbi:MAG: thermonuclease family protein [Cellvibrionaceae bacterium]
MRLPSINAPELAIDGRGKQPLARASRAAAQAFFADTDIVHLSFESRRTDRYGRLLAHVIHPSGRNLESYLVGQGLALPLAVPPDLAFAECLSEMAEQARREARGIWAASYWQPLPATRLDGVEAEFRVMCGRVSKVDRQQDIWVELEGDLVIRIARGDLRHFQQSDFALGTSDQWLGRTLQIAGWLQDRRDNEQLMRRGFKPWMMQARTPHALNWITSADCE